MAERASSKQPCKRQHNHSDQSSTKRKHADPHAVSNAVSSSSSGEAPLKQKKVTAPRAAAALPINAPKSPQFGSQKAVAPVRSPSISASSPTKRMRKEGFACDSPLSPGKLSHDAGEVVEEKLTEDGFTDNVDDSLETVTRECVDLLDELANLAKQAHDAHPSTELHSLQQRIENFHGHESLNERECVVLPLGNNGMGKSFLISCLSEMTCADGATYEQSSGDYLINGNPNTNKLECLKGISTDQLCEWSWGQATDNTAQEEKRQAAIEGFCNGSRFEGHTLPYLYPSHNGARSTTSYETQSIFSGIFHCAVTYYSLKEIRDVVTLYHTHASESNRKRRNTRQFELLQKRLTSIFGRNIPASAEDLHEESFPKEMRPWLGKTLWFCGNGESLEDDRTKCRDIQQMLLSDTLDSSEFAQRKPLIKVNRIGQPAEFLRGGVKYLDVPGLNDADPIKEHCVNQAVLSAGVLLIIHDRTLEQAENIMESLKDPQFGKTFFDEFRQHKRAIMFLMIQEKSDKHNLQSFLDEDARVLNRKKAELSVAEIQAQFREAFRSRWEDASEEELELLAQHIIVDYSCPLLHLSTLVNDGAIVAAKEEYGDNAVNELLDFIGLNTLLGLPTRLKLNQLRNELQDFVEVVDEVIRWLGCTSGDIAPPTTLSAAARNEIQTRFSSLSQVKRRRGREVTAVEQFHQQLCHMPHLRAQLDDCVHRVLASAVPDTAGQSDSMSVVKDLVLQDFEQRAANFSTDELQAVLQSTYELDHKNMPLRTFVSNRLTQVLRGNGFDLKKVPKIIVRDVLEPSVTEHLRSVILSDCSMSPSRRSSHSSNEEANHSIWLQQQLAKRSEFRLLEDTTAQWMVKEKSFKQEMQALLNSVRDDICDRPQFRGQLTNERQTRDSLARMTRKLLNTWINEVVDKLPEMFQLLASHCVEKLYTALTVGIQRNPRPPKTAEVHFFSDKVNIERVRDRLGNPKRLSKERKAAELRKLWTEASAEERRPYEDKADRDQQRVTKSRKKAPATLCRIGDAFVADVLRECQRDESASSLKNESTANALDHLRAMKTLLAQNGDFSRDEKLLKELGAAMCSRVAMAKAYNYLVKRHKQLEFKMTCNSSLHKDSIGVITTQNHFVEVANNAEVFGWQPYPSADQAQQMLRRYRFICVPTTEPDTLFASILHQLKGHYTQEDVAALRSFICLRIIRECAHDERFRATAAALLEKGKSVNQFAFEAVDTNSQLCSHPLLLETFCRSIRVGFLVWGRHPKPLLFGNLAKRNKIYNLLCVQGEEPSQVQFISLNVRRYTDDIRLEANPSPSPAPSLATNSLLQSGGIALVLDTCVCIDFPAIAKVGRELFGKDWMERMQFCLCLPRVAFTAVNYYKQRDSNPTRARNCREFLRCWEEVTADPIWRDFMMLQTPDEQHDIRARDGYKNFFLHARNRNDSNDWEILLWASDLKKRGMHVVVLTNDNSMRIEGQALDLRMEKSSDFVDPLKEVMPMLRKSDTRSCAAATDAAIQAMRFLSDDVPSG